MTSAPWFPGSSGEDTPEGILAALRRTDPVGLAQHLGDEAVGAAAEGRGEDRALLVDHEDIRLALVGAELVHLLLEGRDVGGEELIRQAEPRRRDRKAAHERDLEARGRDEFRRKSVIAAWHDLDAGLGEQFAQSLSGRHGVSSIL